MWSTLPYLVKVQICFALLWIVYRLFLQRDGRFARSRAYLLLSVPVSFLIPLLSIPVLPASQPAAVHAVPAAAVAEAPVRTQPVSGAEDASLFAEAAPEALSASPAPVSTSTRVATAASPGTRGPASLRAAAASVFAALVPAGWPGLLYAWLLWCGVAGSLLLLLYYLGHTLRWVRLMREGNVSRMLDDVRVVYSPAVSSPCSLFNCIFVNRRDLGENEFRELMAHELCHIRLRHSWDRLLAVVVTLFCWWNPFVWLWHRSLCEVHEYQADDAVLRCGFDAEQYITLMVSSVAGARTTLASGFSYSLVRKRLQMLSRGASRRAGLRMLLVVPALAVLLALFSFTERPLTAGTPEQAPAELSDQLLSALGYSDAHEASTFFSGDDTVPADDAEQTAAVQPGAASADASGVPGYGAPASGGESPAGGRVSSKGDDVVIMVDGKVQDGMIRLTRFAGRNISGVSASSGFSVEVRESNSTSVEIAMPAEWQQYLTCELTPDGVVQLGLDTRRLSGSRGLRINKGQLTAVVSLPKFSQLKCSSGAVIRCTGNFKGGAVQLRASSGGMIDGLSLKASEALIDASSGGVIRNVAVTAPKADVEISSGAVIKGVSLDAAVLTCRASSGAVATLEHTGKAATLSTGSGGTIRISGATQTLSLHKSTSGGHINTDGYRVSGS